MQLNLENPIENTIQCYDSQSITINQQKYENNFAVSEDGVIALPELNLADISISQLPIKPQLEIILLAQKPTNYHVNLAFKANLAKNGIGIEVMSVEAACRTYNLLLQEGRIVLAAFILSPM